MIPQTAEDKATKDLIDWRILERNSVNEILPTADFLVWLYDRAAFSDGYPECDNMTEKEIIELMKEQIKDSIIDWTMQTIDGRAVARLDCDQHVKIVYAMIKDIHDRRMEIHMKKITSREKVKSKK